MTASVVLLALWLAWSGWLLFRLMLGVWASWRLRSQVRPLDNDTLIEKLHVMLQTMKVKKSVALAESTAIDRPMIWCWGTAVIVLPSEYREVKQVEWSSVFAHELAHLQRRDHWWSLLGQVFVCILPWHPLVRWLVSRMSLLSEQACDQVAIAGQANLPDSITRYAQSLVGFELAARDGYLKTKTSPIVLFAPFVTTRSGFVLRVQRLLSCRAVEAPVGWLLRAAIIALPVVLLGCLLLRPGSSWHSMAMSAAGSDFAVADDDPFVELEPGVRLLGESNPFSELTKADDWEIDPSGKRIAFVGEKAIYLWNVEEQRVISKFALDQHNWLSKLSWSGNGRRLAVAVNKSGGDDPEILLFDQNLEHLGSLVLDDAAFDDGTPKNITIRVTAIAFSNDQRTLAFTTDTRCYLAELEPFRAINSMPAPMNSQINAIYFHNNNIFALGNISYLIDPKQNARLPLPSSLQALSSSNASNFDRERNEIWTAQQLPDGFVFRNLNQQLQVVNLESGDCQIIEKGEKSFRSVSTPTNDKSLLAVLVYPRDFTNQQGNSGEILIYDVGARELKHRFRGVRTSPWKIEITPENDAVLIDFRERSGVMHWGIDPSKIEQDSHRKFMETVDVLDISQDGTHVVARGGFTTSVIDWKNGTTGPVLNSPNLIRTQSQEAFWILRQGRSGFELSKYSYSNADRELIATYYPRTAQFNWFANRFLNASLPEEEILVVPIAISVDSPSQVLRVLVQDTKDGYKVQTFDLKTKQRLNEALFKGAVDGGHEYFFNGGAISKKGDCFAVYETQNKVLRVFNANEKSVRFEQNIDRIKFMIFGSDSSWLAVATDNEVVVLATESGEEIKRIEIRDPLVGYASEANQLVVTAATQGSPLTFYSTDDWSVEFEHTTSTANRTAIAITPNAKRLVLGLSDSRLEFWETEKIKR